VIVPSLDASVLLGRLLDSLRRQTIAHHVVVVDNGSTDDTRAMLARRFPEVGVVALRENVGFGAAINRGVASTAARELVLLNNDVVCPPTFLEALIRPLDARSGIVMTSGVLVAAEQQSRIDSAGVMFDRTLLAFDYLHGEPVSVLESEVPDPLGPCGGAAAFDRRAFEEVGGFDEAIFVYLEDVDLVARLIDRGGLCRLAAGARAVHRHAATLGSGSTRKNELMGWARGYTIGKYRLHRRPRMFVRAVAGELVIAGAQLVVDGTPVSVPSRLRGFRAGLDAPPQPLPELPPPAASLSLGQVLRQRKRRRKR
jgi:GT2 family glycosyltransferase